MDLKNIPVTKDWRLNERHLGDLQGKEIQKMEEMYGREQVDKWRKDFLTVPLEITDDNPTKNSYEENAQTPKSESYKDLQDRVLPFWKSVIVSAHQNTLRIIIKYLENIPDEDIASINVPTGTPIIYYLDPEGSVISKE